MTAHYLKPGICPTCRQPYDLLSGGTRAPRKGDVSVCALCNVPHEVSESGGLVPLNMEQLSEAERRVVERIQAHLRSDRGLS